MNIELLLGFCFVLFFAGLGYVWLFSPWWKKNGTMIEYKESQLMIPVNLRTGTEDNEVVDILPLRVNHQ